MGGAEAFTCEVAKMLVRAGHEVTLFTSKFPNCKGEEVLDGVRVVRADGRYSVYWKPKSIIRIIFQGKVTMFSLMRLTQDLFLRRGSKTKSGRVASKHRVEGQV